MTNEEIRKALLEPFAPEKIRWRIRTKLGQDHAYVLAYIDARDVMDRLDWVFGVFGWNREQTIKDGNHVCTIEVSYKDEDEKGFYKTVEDVAEPTDIEAQKGGASDSFKRAAVNLGINRVCYTLGDTKVKLENGYIPDYERKRLRDEVLLPAYYKFAKEYGLDATKWVLAAVDPPKQKTPKKTNELLNKDFDQVLLEYVIGRRQELWDKMVTHFGDAGNASEVLKKISAKLGKWDGLDILGKLTYIKLLSDEYVALTEKKKPLPLSTATKG